MAQLMRRRVVFVDQRMALHAEEVGFGETYEIDANRRDVALCVCVVRKSEQQTRLSDTAVSNQEELEEVVVSAKSRSQHCSGL